MKKWLESAAHKSFILTILAGLYFLLGAKEQLVSLLGEHWGIITIGILTMVYQCLVAFFKRFYNTGSSSWSNATIWLNICLLIPELFAVINAWSADYNVSLSGGFLMFMSKMTIITNMVVLALTTDWKTVLAGGLPTKTGIKEIDNARSN